MSTKQAMDLVKNSRRSKKRKPGDGTLQRRFIFLMATSSYALASYFYIKNYKTSLPLYQQNTLIFFYAFYVLRTNVSNFYLRNENYFSWKAVIGLGLFIYPMLTFPLSLFCRPMEQTPTVRYMIPVALYLVGSVMHSSYEFTRFFFKKHVNKNKLYKLGLASVVRHPNYFADLLLYLGWSFMSNNPWNLLIPTYQFYHFYKKSIPELEAYLKAKYGDKEFARYRQDVKALIPFVL
eukprot:424308_1